MVWKIAVAVLVLVAASLAARLAYLSATAPVPPAGLVDGRLRPCPPTPNCVSSESSAPEARIEPLHFQGPPELAWADLRRTLTVMGGTVVREQDGFLWVTFTSRIFRFVDDVECRLVAAQGSIEVRSASRVGKGDLGVNRRRMDELRARFGQTRGAVVAPSSGTH